MYALLGYLQFSFRPTRLHMAWFGSMLTVFMETEELS